MKEAEKPLAYQIFGSEADIIAYAADKLNWRENAILDINMGCPVSKVVKNMEGAALMKDPELVYRVVKAAVNNTDKPVTVKMRLGWDKNSINVLEIAKVAEEAGVAAICIHARTRDMFYKGQADWEAISRVRKKLSIPLIGSGDVFTAEAALTMLKETGVDYVMIARGALGNPWIFREANALWKGLDLPPPPDMNEKTWTIHRHFDMLLSYKGEYAGIREMRKHLGWYLKGISGAADLKRRANSITDKEEMKLLIESLNSFTFSQKHI